MKAVVSTRGVEYPCSVVTSGEGRLIVSFADFSKTGLQLVAIY